MREGIILAVAVAVVTSRSPCIADDKPTNVVLPSNYPLTSVTFELREGGMNESTTVRIDGAGNGSVRETWPTRPATNSSFKVDPAEVFQLLQACYRGGFFDLQPNYGPPNFVRLGKDGMVETLVTVVSDNPGRSLSVRIGDYTKTVGYLPGLGNPPSVVTELERRLNELRSLRGESDAHGGRSSNYPLSPPHSAVTALAQGGTHRALWAAVGGKG